MQHKFSEFQAAKRNRSISLFSFSRKWKIYRHLRVAPPAKCGFSNSWFAKTGYARLFVKLTGICNCVRISGDVIPDDVIAILRFWRFGEKMASLGRSLAKKGWTQNEFKLFHIILRCLLYGIEIVLWPER